MLQNLKVRRWKNRVIFDQLSDPIKGIIFLGSSLFILEIFMTHYFSEMSSFSTRIQNVPNVQQCPQCATLFWGV